jgi:predicted dehydrogenase
MNPAARLMVHDRGVDLLPGNALAPDDRRQALISYRVGDIQVPALPEREALKAVLAEFADAIAKRRAPLTDARAGIRVLELLEAATRSAEDGGTRIPVNMEVGR